MFADLFRIAWENWLKPHDEMKGKVERFAAPKGVSVRTALVYDGNLAPSVEADGYFDAVVPFRRLLGL